MAIRISPDAMKERAAEYRGQASAVADVITKMDGLLSVLQDEWEGKASESFSGRYQELRPNFLKAEELINEIATALDATAQAMSETDSSLASQY